MGDFFTKENCCRSMFEQSVETNQYCIAIIKPEVLCEEHRTKDFQLVELLSGLGCKPHSFSDECYVRLCSTRRKTYIKRTDLLGIADEETENYAYKLMNPFTEEEAKFLIPIIQQDYEMFNIYYQVYHKEDPVLKEKWKTILAKLSTFTFQPYSKIEYCNILTSLMSSDIVKSKIESFQENKIDPAKDSECIFINTLYKKIYKLMEESHV